MSIVTVDRPRGLAPPVESRPIDMALLGCGSVGSAVAALSATAAARPIRIVGALVRHPERPRPAAAPARLQFTRAAATLLDRRPDVVVEVLGSVEPARTIVRDALERGIPVVTANKSLLAACGDELAETAARTGVPLLYEASVLAGVPFLGALARRPHAAALSRLTGIVNGTSNFILSRMAADGEEADAALGEAQRRGLAEPDPRSDVDGIDAAEKLIVLLRHFAFGNASVRDLEITGIRRVQRLDFALAAELGGDIKPVISARRSDAGVDAFVGPALVPQAHPLARIAGVDNALQLRTAYGDLMYSGPGAGPVATATTILDDVVEAVSGTAPANIGGMRRGTVRIDAPATGWFVRLTASALPAGDEIADLLGAHGIWLRRTAERQGADRAAAGLLTHPCARERIERALAALDAAWRCEPFAIRALES
jgi:homoserine dehydrogenase